ncbi:hypothetical protein ABT095_29005 [Kitasatospora sp. NPDC002227]|uniref:hypothetical protein n=1 Tax=Kitasatospora sp. NPDC002227 TaxID=3154773 RepID=UPI003321757F
MDAKGVLDTTPAAETAPKWCPSGQAHAPESVVLGVRSQEDGGVTYLAEPIPAAEALPLIPEGIEPTRVLRFASHCVSACSHRSGSECTLISKIRTLPPKADANLPHCHLRHDCKWWSQVGAEACGRCPAVVTTILATETTVGMAADPSVTPEQLQEWIAANPAGPSGS